MKIKDLKNLVNSYRDKAIILLRLTEGNRLIERLQEAKRELKRVVDAAEKAKNGIERVNSGDWAPSLSQAKDGKTLEELKEQALKNLNEALNELNQALIKKQEVVSNIEKDIEELANGERKFDRNTISDKAEELIERDALNFKFENNENE